MLTKEDKLFIEYWEKNRDKEKRLFRQLVHESPLALVFALPVLVVVIFHDWYKNMIPISRTQIILIVITVMAIAVFYAVFRIKFKWDYHEQLYKELKLKEKKEDAAEL